MAQPYTVEKEINGVKYTAQFNGVREGARAIDNSYIEGTSNISLEKIGDYVLKHVIVDPANLDMDDFESMDDFKEVVEWGQKVMQGKFRDKNKGTDKK